MTDCHSVDRRMLPGLFAGLAGAAFGVATAVFGLPLLGVLAAGCALFAGGATVALFQQVQRAEGEALGAADAVTLRHLEVLTSRGSASVIDDDTGLPDGRFFELALDGRVASARRHLWPLTLVLVELWLEGAEDEHTAPGRREVLGDFALLVRRTLREADIACRISDTTFGLILEDTSEEGGVWTAERLQIGLARSGFAVRRMAAGVASYPTHAMRAEELRVQARAALDRACAAAPDQGLGQVEVARVDFA
jgi:diguanylate cyclase (GGDEF)-like protein